ncbi:MAG TPA: IS256 family transposase [Chthoniobacterales bacterium]
MKNDTVVSLPERANLEPKSPLEQLIAEGARKMLQAAIENEVQEYLQAYGARRTDDGQAVVVRNGHLPERDLVTGVGPLKVRQPRVRRRDGQRFSSAILPRYLRRVPSIDALIPTLYLKGISTGDFTDALTAILGEKAAGLSATNIVRLKAGWEDEYQAWRHRDLSAKRYVYWWADGIYFNVRLDDDRTCVLVLIGATEDGTKELLAVVDGFRESKDSWGDLLRELKHHGLTQPPKLATGDGSLGFWIALQEEFGTSVEQQRCWVHKTANVLDKLPKSLQGRAKEMLHDLYLAPARHDALTAYDRFLSNYQLKYPKACDCLEKDKGVLFTFFDFPAEHWSHLRTTNPIESTFATVRLRTQRTKGCGSRIATLTMVYKLGLEAQKAWRRLNGADQIAKIITGTRFVDGVEITKNQQAA